MPPAGADEDTGSQRPVDTTGVRAPGIAAMLPGINLPWATGLEARSRRRRWTLTDGYIHE